MITITKKPPLVAFAGNPVNYAVHSNGYLVSDGSFATYLFTFSAIETVEGHSFTLHFDGNVLTFLISMRDDGGGLIIGPASSGMTVEQWTSQVLQAFLGNYLLYLNYSIFRLSSNMILLTAKTKGSAFTMSMTDNTVTGLSGSSTHNGTDHVLVPDFGVLATIFDKNLAEIGQDIKSVDASGNARFDISEYLKSVMALDQSRKFTFPETADFIHVWTNFVLQYTVAFADKIGDLVKRLTRDDPKFVLSGGLNRETLVYYNSLGTDFFSTIGYCLTMPVGAIPQFLTWQPNSKITTRDTNEKLFFLVPEQPAGSTSTAQLNVRIYFTDGSSPQTRTFGPSIYIHSWDVIECSVGFDHLGLGTMFSKTVKAWEVFFVQNGTKAISEGRRYSPDAKAYINNRVFYYRNSFSAFDCIRFTGVSEVTTEYEQTTGLVILDEEYTESNSPLRQFQTKESLKVKVSSGWLPKEWKEALRDLLLSSEIYEQIGSRLVRIQNDTKKVLLYRDKVYNYSLDFEYEYANSDEYYSSLQEADKPGETGGDITADSTKFTADSVLITADRNQY